MKTKTILLVFGLFGLSIFFQACHPDAKGSGVKYMKAGDERIPVTEAEYHPFSGPLNATYMIERNEITLQNGRCEIPSAPDSATQIRTSVYGDVVEGDLDGDGDRDAILILLHDPGGSGTFYYLAIAENRNGHYQGTNAVLLGDRIAPIDIRIRSGVVIARFANRRSQEPMSTAPSVAEKVYLAFVEGKLKALKPLSRDEQLLPGRVTIGHEVRSFRPCSHNADYWLSKDSPALEEIIEKYKKESPDARPYRPLFMVLTGRFVQAPRDGFGADYPGAFLATQAVAIRPHGRCLNE